MDLGIALVTVLAILALAEFWIIALCASKVLRALLILERFVLL